MAQLGQYLLYLALAMSLYGALSNWFGRGRWAASARGAVWALALVNSGAVLVLLYLLVTSDFRVAYVVNHTDRSLALPYKLAALWGGDAGSLLFWVWILSLYAAYLVWSARRRELLPQALGVLAGIAVFFQVLLVAAAPPFAQLAQAQPDGLGLNPLLENPMMLVHPPTLYLGYVGMAVPFAYGVAALWHRRRDSDWLRLTRRWTVVAWLFLSVGIVLGGMWAYVELGWGGYWEWDPVENASFMPWLTATAFLHTAVVAERRRSLKTWTFALLFITFFLTIFGTFLTRSGLIASVHAFSGTKVGPYFIWFLVLVVLGVGALLWARWDLLRGERPLEGAASREAAVALVALVLLGATVLTLIGTLSPILSDIGSKQQVTVNPAFFSAAVVPLLVAVVLIMGAGPLLKWRDTPGRALWERFRLPVAAGGVMFLVLMLTGIHRAGMVAGGTAAAFLITGVAQALVWGVRGRMRGRGEGVGRALVGLVGADRRRWGGYLVHVAVAVLMVGVAASTLYTQETTQNLAPGHSLNIAGYRLTYHHLDSRVHGHHLEVYAPLAVSDGARPLGTMTPREFFLPGQTTPDYARVAIRGGWLRDVYVILGWDPKNSGSVATVRVLVEPLVSWIWIGLYLLAAGGVFALSAPARRDRP